MRNTALDYYKFIAVFMMLFGHTIIWLLSSNDMGVNQSGWEFLINSVFPIIGIIPNSLPFAMGMSLRYIYNKKWFNLKELDLAKFGKKSLIIALIGFLMNLLTWGYKDFFTWDVLQFYALASFVITVVLKFFGKKALLLVSFFALFSKYFSDTFFVSGMRPNKFLMILFGDPTGFNFWPLFPWLSMMIFGLFFADLFLLIRNDKKYTSIIIFSLFVGASVLYINGFSPFIKIDVNNFWGPDIMMPHAGKVVALSVAVAIVFSLLTCLKKNKIVEMISKNILLFYVFHTILINHAVNIYKQYLEINLINVSIFLMIQIMFFYFLIKFMNRFDYKRFL